MLKTTQEEREREQKYTRVRMTISIFASAECERFTLAYMHTYIHLRDTQCHRDIQYIPRLFKLSSSRYNRVETKLRGIIAKNWPNTGNSLTAALASLEDPPPLPPPLHPNSQTPTHFNTITQNTPSPLFDRKRSRSTYFGNNKKEHIYASVYT